MTSYSESLKYLSFWVENYGKNEKFDQLWKIYVEKSYSRQQLVSLKLYQKESENWKIVMKEGSLSSYEELRTRYRYYELVVYQT